MPYCLSKVLDVFSLCTTGKFLLVSIPVKVKVFQSHYIPLNTSLTTRRKIQSDSTPFLLSIVKKLILVIFFGKNHVWSGVKMKK